MFANRICSRNKSSGSTSRSVMRSVSRFESNLLKILHCFLGQGSVDQVLPLLQRPISRPNCLSRDAVELIQNSLGSGTVMLLTRQGAWMRERFLRDDQISEGRLWERTKPGELGLTFSPASLDFLIWLTESEAASTGAAWVPSTSIAPTDLTTGDQLLMYLAARTMRDAVLADHWYKQRWCQCNPLIALSMPDRFATAESMPDVDYESWMSGPRACLLEAMQSELTATVVQIERDKSKVSTADQMIRLGQTQSAVWERFLDAVERHGRRDLCRFLLDAAKQLLTADARSQQWIASLDTSGLRLADRTEVYENASSFMRAAQRLRNWHAESLAVGFFDEGYAESQLWKSLWEAADGDDVAGHANRLIGELTF